MECPWDSCGKSRIIINRRIQHFNNHLRILSFKNNMAKTGPSSKKTGDKPTKLGSPPRKHKKGGKVIGWKSTNFAYEVWSQPAVVSCLSLDVQSILFINLLFVI